MRLFRWVSIKVEKGKDAPHSKKYVLFLVACFITLLVILTLLLVLRANHICL